ncbi:MAG: nucleoside 2-deoxyribosyltransferase [Bosea sp.]|uniref:nucleoside 2-deoxyribosyltransferase n=1 Tax=Bosea sp. (in: a-proteobacteria) TaxID=1871050 RepID=UPI0023A77BF8|nr:nucleoside 2-deoxyribosyltransferase [Bosea sp. (in: a-proteobacteria)]MCP4737467.1 nucleoside 2-deoxyribosyltransferase [Bosea sp. (in: a-proteobacteria)]
MQIATRPQIYLAGPLFSQAEKEFNSRLAQSLEFHFDVFLPQRDGALLIELIQRGLNAREAEKRIFDTDMDALKRCDFFVLVLDGRSVDEGAAFELGVSFILGKPCYGLQTDPRRLMPSGNNPMIEGALKSVSTSVEDLLSVLVGR